MLKCVNDVVVMCPMAKFYRICLFIHLVYARNEFVLDNGAVVLPVFSILN
jgi:hypothetical protein